MQQLQVREMRLFRINYVQCSMCIFKLTLLSTLGVCYLLFGIPLRLESRRATVATSVLPISCPCPALFRVAPRRPAVRGHPVSFPSRPRISSGPCPPCGLARSRWVKRAWRWSKSARAGVSLLSATTTPIDVERKTPRVARPIQFIAA